MYVCSLCVFKCDECLHDLPSVINDTNLLNTFVSGNIISSFSFYLLMCGHTNAQTHTRESSTSEYFSLSSFCPKSHFNLNTCRGRARARMRVCVCVSIIVNDFWSVATIYHSILSKHRIHKRKRVFNHRNKSSTMRACVCTFLSCSTGIWKSSESEPQTWNCSRWTFQWLIVLEFIFHDCLWLLLVSVEHDWIFIRGYRNAHIFRVI